MWKAADSCGGKDADLVALLKRADEERTDGVAVVRRSKSPLDEARIVGQTRVKRAPSCCNIAEIVYSVTCIRHRL